MERGVMTQRAAVLLLSLLCFVSLPNKRLGGPGNMKRFMVFVAALAFLIANNKVLNKI